MGQDILWKLSKFGLDFYTPKKGKPMKQTAHIMPNYGRYGRNGYVCIATGLPNFICATIKQAKSWCIKMGLEFIVL